MEFLASFPTQPDVAVIGSRSITALDPQLLMRRYWVLHYAGEVHCSACGSFAAAAQVQSALAGAAETLQSNVFTSLVERSAAALDLPVSFLQVP